MMRTISLSLILLLLVSAIGLASEIPQISEELISNAKLVLPYLEDGMYEHVEASAEISKWQDFVEEDISVVSEEEIQREYAVAYWSGVVWKVAVPTSTPDNDDVETLILTSPDGISFTDYHFTTWAEVKGEYLFAPYVIWDKEYIESAPVIAID